MQWIIAVVCIVALMNGTSETTNEVPAPILNILLVISGSFLVPSLTAWQTAGIIRRYNRKNVDLNNLRNTLNLYHFMHVGVWAAFCVFITVVLQWGLVVRSALGAFAVPLIDELLILVPVLFPLLAGWAILYEIERLVAKNSESESEIQQTRWEYVGIRARWYLVMSVVPILIMWLARDVATIQQPFVDQKTWMVAICCLFLVGKIAAFPFLMAAIWDTRSIRKTNFGSRLYDIAVRSGVSIWDVRLWRTGGQILNAVVAGMIPRFRIILMTDRLVDELDEEQIEGVFRHEVAHASRGHLPTRIAAVLFPLIGYFVIDHFNPAALEKVFSVFEQAGVSMAWCQTVFLPTMYVAYLVAILGWISRSMEHDADIGACLRGNESGKEQLNDQAIRSFSSALLKIASIQKISVTKKSWLHPSMVDRFEFLHSIRKDKSIVSSFRNRFSFQLKLLFGLLFATTVFFLVS